MPSACAVPSCKTGKSNKLKQRLSIFKVPNNNDLRKKWENAIPDVYSLKTTQYVCERHFEEQYIIRRYIKHDSEGNIIADIPYKRPRLQINTVPSLFKEHIKPLQVNQSIENKLESIQNDCISNELPQLPASNDDFGSIINGIEIPLQPSCENSQLFANLPMQDCNLFNSSINEKLLGSGTAFEDKNLINDDIDLFEKKVIIENADSNEKIKFINKPVILSTENKDNHIIKAESAQSKAIDVFKATTYTLKNESSNFADALGLDHNYTISFPKILKYSNEVCIDDEKIDLPQYWGISESFSKTGKKLVFTHTHIQTKDIANSATLHKCVTIDFCDGQIQYFIYGRQINQLLNLSLPNTFSKKIILTILLKKFQGMHACEGLGPIDLSLIKESNEMDNTLCFGYSYHHNQCSLLSLTKMCERCSKLQKTILRRHKRLLQRAKKPNVLTTLNVMDSQKLRFLKRKLYREKKRLKNMPN